MGGSISKNVWEGVPLKALPSDEELSELGGRWFVRPSDGKRLEYYVLGNSEITDITEKDANVKKRAIVNLITTNATGHLYHHWKQEDVLKCMSKHDCGNMGRETFFVNVSTAGIGVSDIYGDNIYDVSAKDYLENTSRDITALLKSLGVTEVYPLGISGGYETSAHLASYLCSGTHGVAVKGWATISGLPWRTRDHYWMTWAEDGTVKNYLIEKFMMSRFAPLVFSYMFPMGEESFKASLPADVQEIIGDDLSLMVFNMNRANAYTCFPLGMFTIMGVETEVQQHTDLQALARKDVSVHLYFSTKDEMVPYAVAEWLMKEIPTATLHTSEANHMCPCFVEAIDDLLSNDH